MVNRQELAAGIREALGVRDRARAGHLFRPDRAIAADARFVATVTDLAAEHAAELAREAAAEKPPRSARTARKAPGASGRGQGTPGSAEGRTRP